MGAGQDAFGTGTQGVVPEVIGGAEDDSGAIGREDGRSAEVALDLERQAGAGNDGRVNRGWRFLSWTEEQESNRRKESQGSDGPRKECAAVTQKRKGRCGGGRGRTGCGDAFEFESEVARRLPAVVRILGEAAADNVVERTRRERFERGNGRRLFLEDGGS